MARRRIGIWLLGARGGVATTTIVGLIALRRKMIGDEGLVSQLPHFRNLGLCDWSDLLVGGHEIRESTLVDEAHTLRSTSRVLDEALIAGCKAELDEIDTRIRPGSVFNAGPSIQRLATPQVRRRRERPRAAIERIQDDMADFTRGGKLDELIVVNVASTEPAVEERNLPSRWRGLSKLLDNAKGCPLRPSSLYAIAAIELGRPYINFTPSPGSAPAAIQELAEERGVCHMGRDGKTGETLLKSVLAPMFACRNLNVMSWVGHNIFGNLDGKVLEDPAHKRAKVATKDSLLRHVLGYEPQTRVGIEFVQSLGDWKTAWDHVHFRGFLGTPMVLQFIWQGCDSLLAAPLVLDLVRFTELAQRRGQRGLLTFLASFFKRPLGVEEDSFAKQFQMLELWAEQASIRDI